MFQSVLDTSSDNRQADTRQQEVKGLMFSPAGKALALVQQAGNGQEMKCLFTYKNLGFS